jgi:7-keto-8-aminopelargonate synthetase-like enzyme
MGLRVMPSDSAIIPVLVGEAAPALRFASVLRERGVYTPAVRPPSVPPGMCRIRVTIMATHTEDQIDAALDAFKAAKDSVFGVR